MRQVKKRMSEAKEHANKLIEMMMKSKVAVDIHNLEEPKEKAEEQPATPKYDPYDLQQKAVFDHAFGPTGHNFKLSAVTEKAEPTKQENWFDRQVKEAYKKL
jgi:hypothetical protein